MEGKKKKNGSQEELPPVRLGCDIQRHICAVSDTVCAILSCNSFSFKQLCCCILNVASMQFFVFFLESLEGREGYPASLHSAQAGRFRACQSGALSSEVPLRAGETEMHVRSSEEG